MMDLTIQSICTNKMHTDVGHRKKNKELLIFFEIIGAINCDTIT